tara:strand:- start:411 stop:1397 length:987 start_codon:yes stop_codon:yes gene_type:complete
MIEKNNILALVFLAMASFPISAEEKDAPEIPEAMAMSATLIRARVIEVGNSQSGRTEHTSTPLKILVMKTYRGKALDGREMDLKIGGWLGSEKDQATKFRNTMKDVVLCLDQSYNPFLKSKSGYKPGKMFPGTAEALQQAKTAAKLPIGWSVKNNGSITSPWAAVKEKYIGKSTVENKCSGSDRPAFLADARLKMVVDRVMKLKEEGMSSLVYKVTIINESDEPITLDALRTSDDKILWKESLLFINHDKAWLPRGFTGFTENSKSAVIPAKGEISTEVSYTAQFEMFTTVCLGNLSFCIYENCGRNYESYIKKGTHPKSPFQKKPVE